jgi:acetyltransferase-like isoleucine patch superfamily enzyme
MSEIIFEFGKGSKFNEKTLIKSEGENNRLILGDHCKFGSLGTPKVEFLGSGNTIRLDDRAVLKRGHLRIVGDNQVIHIGKKTTINGVYILVDEQTSVTIGDDCMFSYSIELRTTDAHSILDKVSGKRINNAADIVIGDRVWVGKEVMINKGVTLSSDMIVGARALVTRSFDAEYCAIAGVPAAVVKKDVTWDRRKL